MDNKDRQRQQLEALIVKNRREQALCRDLLDHATTTQQKRIATAYLDYLQTQAAILQDILTHEFHASVD